MVQDAPTSSFASATSKVSGVAAIHYAVKDMPRATAFWKSLLDIAETSFEFDGATEWVLRDGSAFVIGTFGGEWAQSRGAQFEVADVEATSELVKQLGGSIIGDLRDFGGCTMQWCEDPEGNSFTLHHRK
ncbi:MAG: VOC family protein [Candidatus Velthaea sp.]|jgi:predicted enzyme related to lactoylglutathione lyase